MVLFLSANRLNKKIINKKMEFQQMSDEKNLKLHQEDQKKIEFQYMDFYANFEIVDSDQVSSDLDDLEAFHETLQANRYDICCRNQRERDEIKKNPRVAEIPTVYLVSCIRTEHLPERRDWRIDSQQETKEEQINYRQDSEDIQGKMYKLISDEDNGINSISVTGQILKPRNNRSQIVQNSQHLIRRNREKQIKIYRVYERPWKTDYITIGDERGWEKQNKQKKLMHNDKNPKQNKINQTKVKKKVRNENSVNNSQENQPMRIQTKGKVDERNYLSRRFQQIYEQYQQRSKKSLWGHMSRNASILSKHSSKNQAQQPQKVLTLKLEHMRSLNSEPPQNHQSPIFRTESNHTHYYKQISFYKEKTQQGFQRSLIPQQLIQRKRSRQPYNLNIKNQANCKEGEKEKNKYRSIDEINLSLETHKQKL